MEVPFEQRITFTTRQDGLGSGIVCLRLLLVIVPVVVKIVVVIVVVFLGWQGKAL